MEKKLLITSLLSLLLCIVSYPQDCKNLPKSFMSYSEALSRVKSATYLIQESINCNRSSWINSANFYSCDGTTGFFILITKGGLEYIHNGIPIELWQKFKQAKSFGNFYTTQIKDRYQLRLYVIE